VLDTKLFSQKRAEEHSEWFAEQWGDSVPESEEYSISSLVFRAQRPFHPQRLKQLLDQRRELGALQMALAGAGSGEKKRKRDVASAFSQCVRAKGFVWLATRHARPTLLHLAGGSVKLSPGPQWWIDRDRACWPKEASFQTEIVANMSAEWGDRGTTLVVIGLHLDKFECERELNACLLDDDEMRLGPDGWAASLEDPLPASEA
jgi:G3E family GTPase